VRRSWWHSRSGRERFADFLPDAEGVVESGHSPLAGVLILTIAAVFGGLLAWSALAGVEQVVRAQGKVAPAARVKVINHPDGGRIAGVHVADGDRVEAGDPLVTFDSELLRAGLDQLLGRWQLEAAKTARLRAEIAGGAPEFRPRLEEMRADLVREQTELLAQRREARASRADALANLVARRKSEVGSLSAEIARLRESRRLLEDQVRSVRELTEKGYYPRLKLASLERELSDLGGEINQVQERRQAAEAALAEAKNRREGLEREWRSTVLAELAATKAERERLADEIVRQEALLRNLVVRAPVAGIVQDLEVTGAGQSVGSNQPLMKLVPTGGGLIIEARVENRDIGYLEVGQPARVKVRAYDFLRYGTLDGRIERIAADANTDPDTGELVYEITVRTESARLGRGDETVSVLPGMAVEVDLLAGERTVLSYLTDRIFRVSDSAFREG